MSESGVTGESSFSYDPDNKVWTTRPVGFADDPLGYRFEPVCFEDQNAGDLDCLVQAASCSAGPDGRLVWWFSGLRSVDPSTWARISSSPSCIYSEDPAAFEERLRAAVLSAFQESPIAPGQLSVQPSPHTLIGAHTNVYVEAGEQVFEMNLLGQSIRIVASPTEYTFDYGDGTSYGPARVPGGPLPESRWGEQTATSHAYEATGDFPVTVTTFFSGEYSVNGGPMVPIDGRAQVTSPAQLLSVWRSESRNVADDCLVNPAGVGC
ncbi:hypothetical protein [Arthrobacter sp. Helios]|uniref:hypothetical protein n=1 Tax=Arthrobacter sp. Helios TaxID=2828862 RepID=UPI0020598156|nr:hypothetical protein [Arthrobacter sp. Helios]UPO77488.1 hypothetical protein ArtHe_01830 [Arthrobacter sp. Helios]